MTEIQKRQAAASDTGYAGALAAALLRDAHAWTALQCELLCGIEALWAEWSRRQNETAARSAHMLHRLCDGSDAVEFAQIQRDWLAGAARRTATAIGDWAGGTSAARKMAAAAVGPAIAVANKAGPAALPQPEAAE